MEDETVQSFRYASLCIQYKSTLGKRLCEKNLISKLMANLPLSVQRSDKI